jgi:hypothetical protein
MNRIIMAMEWILLAMTATKIKEYYAQFNLPCIPEESTALQIHLQERCRSFKNIKTNVIFLLCLYREQSLIMGLFTQVSIKEERKKCAPFFPPTQHGIAQL